MPVSEAARRGVVPYQVALQGLNVEVWFVATNRVGNSSKRGWYWLCRTSQPWRKSGHGPYPTRESAVRAAAYSLCYC